MQAFGGAPARTRNEEHDKLLLLAKRIRKAESVFLRADRVVVDEANNGGVHVAIKFSHVDGVRVRAHLTIFNGPGGRIPYEDSDNFNKGQREILRMAVNRVPFVFTYRKVLERNDDSFHRIIISVKEKTAGSRFLWDMHGRVMRSLSLPIFTEMEPRHDLHISLDLSMFEIPMPPPYVLVPATIPPPPPVVLEIIPPRQTREVPRPPEPAGSTAGAAGSTPRPAASTRPSDFQHAAGAAAGSTPRPAGSTEPASHAAGAAGSTPRPAGWLGRICRSGAGSTPRPAGSTRAAPARPGDFLHGFHYLSIEWPNGSWEEYF